MGYGLFRVGVDILSDINLWLDYIADIEILHILFGLFGCDDGTIKFHFWWIYHYLIFIQKFCFITSSCKWLISSFAAPVKIYAICMLYFMTPEWCRNPKEWSIISFVVCISVRGLYCNTISPTNYRQKY